MKRINSYKKLIQRAKGIIRNAKVPRSFSKKNNNVFSNEQHIIMQLLMQGEKKHYRQMPDFLELLKEEIGLPKIPVFSTLDKFALRVKPIWFEILIAEILKAINTEETLAAIDGTGFSLNNRSKYFCTVAGERNHFMQFNACAELRHKLIASVRIRRKRRNENIDVDCLIRKSAKQLRITHFLADKGYDSERNHETAKKNGAVFIAPLKRAVSVYKTHGFNRKQLRRNFPEEIYRKRVVIEGVFSALKRRYGEMVYAKRFISQKNELLCRVIAYNLGIIVNLSRREIYFLQNLNSYKLKES